ncbi:hypothetical protein P154DRAFT_605602 [Amniculicola lignicola CBS 123094]|uniref:Uncharacterized protein n=1 Tax=Amniculicola lignicola CBS 123094 TaxID=1392246 RepID=A0A6A5W9A9_9PLEO|nr:hypothetical protein P154DRAFT_605602 [Amniculicola lignicola CBS 123094]
MSSQTPTRAAPSAFERLPGEIRQQIYFDVLLDDPECKDTIVSCNSSGVLNPGFLNELVNLRDVKESLYSEAAARIFSRPFRLVFSDDGLRPARFVLRQFRELVTPKDRALVTFVYLRHFTARGVTNASYLNAMDRPGGIEDDIVINVAKDLTTTLQLTRRLFPSLEVLELGIDPIECLKTFNLESFSQAVSTVEAEGWKEPNRRGMRGLILPRLCSLASWDRIGDIDIRIVWEDFYAHRAYFDVAPTVERTTMLKDSILQTLRSEVPARSITAS